MEGELRRAFGLALREERIRRGFSQEDWADVLAVHRTRAGAIERGEKNLTLRSVEELSERVGIDPLILLGGASDGDGDDAVPLLRAAHDGGDVEDDLRVAKKAAAPIAKKAATKSAGRRKPR